MKEYYIVNGKKCKRDSWQDDIIWSMKQSDNTFKHYWIDEQQGLGNSHGGQYMPPWIMNRNRYVVDDFGTVVKYLPHKVSLCWACIDSTGQQVTEWTAR